MSSRLPELVDINGQWHIVHKGKTIQHHAEKVRADAALKVFRAKFKKAKPVKAPKPEQGKPAAEPTFDLPADAVDKSGPDLSILSGSVSKLIHAIAGGDHDEHIDELLAVERAGKNRKSAIRVLESRQG